MFIDKNDCINLKQFLSILVFRHKFDSTKQLWRNVRFRCVGRLTISNSTYNIIYTNCMTFKDGEHNITITNPESST